MSDINRNAGPSEEWLREKAEIEDSCRSVSVGGMAADFGMIPPMTNEAPRVFRRLVEFVRRKTGFRGQSQK